LKYEEIVKNFANVSHIVRAVHILFFSLLFVCSGKVGLSKFTSRTVIKKVIIGTPYPEKGIRMLLNMELHNFLKLNF
jgi:hypothetical protein